MKIGWIFLFVAIIPAIAHAKLATEDPCILNSPKPALSQAQFFNAELRGYTESNLGTLSKEAAIFGKDTRAEPKNAYPYTTIGKLVAYAPEGCADSSCTATLVSGCHILTARHCMITERKSKDIKLSSEDLACQNTGLYSFYARNGEHSYAEKGKYITGSKGKNEEDFAVVKLQKPLGKKIGYMSVMRKSATAFADESKLEVLGYPADVKNGDALVADFDAKFVKTNADPRLLMLRADLWGGASGGPTIAYADNGVPYIAGINTQTVAKVDLTNGTTSISQRHFSDSERNQEKLSTVLASEAFYERMIKFMRENPCE